MAAAPRFTMTVRYTRNTREDVAEGSQVEIMKDGELHADHRSQTHAAGRVTHRSRAAVRRRCFRCFAVTLAGLYLLTLAGLFTRYVSALWERDRLQLRYDDLRNNHSRLQDEVKQLHRKTSRSYCPDGWRRFGCSCYYKVSEKRKWEESRTDCQDRGADLVVISSSEEQEFLRELSEPGPVWIGLKAQFKYRSGGLEPKWEWVDGSALTLTFWEEGHSQKTWHQYVQCCSDQGKWTQSRQYYSNSWICEKAMSSFFCQ